MSPECWAWAELHLLCRGELQRWSSSCWVKDFSGPLRGTHTYSYFMRMRRTTSMLLHWPSWSCHEHPRLRRRLMTWPNIRKKMKWRRDECYVPVLIPLSSLPVVSGVMQCPAVRTHKSPVLAEKRQFAFHKDFFPHLATHWWESHHILAIHFQPPQAWQ